MPMVRACRVCMIVVLGLEICGYDTMKVGLRSTINSTVQSLDGLLATPQVALYNEPKYSTSTLVQNQGSFSGMGDWRLRSAECGVWSDAAFPISSL